MKKFSILAILAIFSFTSAKSQEGFSGGVHIGIPVADASDISSFNLGMDVSYLFNVAEGFDAGFSTGYTYFNGKDLRAGDSTFRLGDFGFVPVAATGRYSFSENMFGAADIGYGISTNGGTGGFYYQPKVGYKTESMDIFGFYKGISRDGATVAAIGIGAMFRL